MYEEYLDTTHILYVEQSEILTKMMEALSLLLTYSTSTEISQG
jgi:hypothetical protein